MTESSSRDRKANRTLWQWAGRAMLAFLMTGGFTQAQTTQPAVDSSKPSDAKPAAAPASLWTAKTLTGDWGGARTALENRGITFQLTYQQQFMDNFRGGLETTNGHDFAGSYDATTLLNFGKLLQSKDLEMTEFFFRFKGTYGGEASDFDKEKVGGLFTTNLDASIEEPVFVDKWWLRQRFMDDRLEIRLGRLAMAKDLIDTSLYADSEDTMFMNQALVVNPTIPMPTGLGAFVRFWPDLGANDWLYFQGAVVDTESRARRTGFDTAFHDANRWNAYWELGLTPKWASAKGPMPGRYRAGGWYDARTKNINMDTLGGRLVQDVQTGDVGFYLGADQMIWKESDKTDDKQGLGLFSRYGYAHGDVNRIEHFWALGASYLGLIPERPKDTLALGVGQGIMSRQLLGTRPLADRETVYEMYYAMQLTPWCVLTPDVQFVTNPGGDRDDRDAIVGGIRLRITF